MKPYFGVTGFVTHNEVEDFRAFLLKRINGKEIHNYIASLNRQIMIGVLMNRKTLGGYIPSNPSRYPLLEEVQKMFTSNELFLNTVHYNCDDWRDLTNQLCYIAEISNVNAIQLNLKWPYIESLKEFKEVCPHINIILQIGVGAYYEVGQSPTALYARIGEYAPYIDSILFDMSGGQGKLVDVNDNLIKIVHDLHTRFNGKIGVGIAGGLCAESVPNLLRITEHMKKTDFGLNNISTDAESLIRDGNDTLIIEEAIKYLLASYSLFV